MLKTKQLLGGAVLLATAGMANAQLPMLGNGQALPLGGSQLSALGNLGGALDLGGGEIGGALDYRATLDHVAFNLNDAAQAALYQAQGNDNGIGGAIAAGGETAGQLLVDLSDGTPFAGPAQDGLEAIRLGTSTLNGAGTAPVDAILRPIVASGGRFGPANLLGEGANVVLARGFPILGTGLLGSEEGVPLVGLLQGSLNADTIGELRAAFGPNGGIPVTGGGIPLTGILANPVAVPVLGPLLANAGNSGGVPLLGSLTGLGGGSDIPVIGTLTGFTDSEIPVIGGLLGGSSFLLPGSNSLAPADLPIDISSLGPEQLTMLMNAVPLNGLPQ